MNAPTNPAAGVLLPCPFCGHDSPEFERRGSGRQSCVVICGNCGCRHESSDEDENSGKSWNARAALTPSGAPKQPRLIGWRTSDYLMETSDPAKAKNWEPHHTLLPIFEGDAHPKLTPPAKAGASQPEPAAIYRHPNVRRFDTLDWLLAATQAGASQQAAPEPVADATVYEYCADDKGEVQGACWNSAHINWRPGYLATRKDGERIQLYAAPQAAPVGAAGVHVDAAPLVDQAERAGSHVHVAVPAPTFPDAADGGSGK